MTPDCIVGIDGSDAARDALRWAVRNPPSPDARVIAVSAWSVPLALRLTMATRPPDVDRLGLAAEAHHAIDAAIGKIGDEADDVERLVVEGAAAAVLLERAEDAALLVVGRHGTSELRHRILGSVSRHCATRATVPTVVVPLGFDGARARNVVVGFDGSENARAALRWALDFFGDDARIEALAAVDVSPWLDVESTVERFPKEVEHERQRLLQAIAEVDPDERAVPTVVLHGPKQALSEIAHDVDIVVLGARGRGAIGSMLLGSVATWMLEQSPCPVVVVPTR